MSTTTTIIPDDQTFGSANDTFSIEDIVKQNNSLTNNDDISISNNDYNDNNDNNDNTTYSSEVIQNNSQTYSLSQVEDLKIDTQDSVLDHVKNQVKDQQQITNDDANRQVDDSYDLDVYNAALQLIKEYQILNIPDDINELDEEKLNSLLSYDQQVRNQQALEYVRNQTNDPRLQEVFDHVALGGNYEDILNVKEMIDEQYDIANLDINNEDDQRLLLSMYLQEGLNPNNPVDQRRLQKIPNEIEEVISNMEGQKMSNEARTYFINKIESFKEQEKLRIKQEQDQIRSFELQKANQEKQWINDFKNTIKSSPWNSEKKDQVVEQFNIVQLTDGTQTELWRYKMDQVWKNPELTMVLMDFLSDFDANTLQFKNRGNTVEKQTTNKIMQIINNKKAVSNKFKSDGKGGDNKSGKSFSGKAINPSTDW